MYHHVSPERGDVAASPCGLGSLVLRRTAAMRAVAPVLAAWLSAASGLVIAVAAGPPAGHGPGAHRGPAHAAAAQRSAVVRTGVGLGMVDSDVDTPPGLQRAAGVAAAPGASALPAVVTPAGDLARGAPAEAARAAGALLQTVTLIATDTDLLTTRAHGRPPQTGAPSGGEEAAGGSPAGTTPLTSVAPNPPATTLLGALPPSHSAAAPRSGSPQRGATGLALPPVYPNVQLIPPASLPAPAQIVPAPAGISVGPIVGLAASVLMLAALAGLRIARRSG